MARKIESPFYTTIEAAEFLRLKPKTLRNMRWRGEGPKYRKHGSKVLYDITELRNFSQRGELQPYNVRQTNLA